MSRSLFEGATGLKKLVHVQSTFERFAVGVSTSDMHINQDQFQRFCTFVLRLSAVTSPASLQAAN